MLRAHVHVSGNHVHVSRDHVHMSRDHVDVSQDDVDVRLDAGGQETLAPRDGGLRLPIGSASVGPLRSACLEPRGGEERSLRAALEPV